MKHSYSGLRETYVPDLKAVGALIAGIQLPSGEIPWSEGDKTDPWDHVEAAIGLSIAGFFSEARRAFEWLARQQLDDGSWYSAYRDGKPEDETRDTNMSAYIAVGLLYYYLITGDSVFTRKMWSTVRKAVDFALSLQQPEGHIFWAISPGGRTDPMALLTGSSSVFMSVKCAMALADRLHLPTSGWHDALQRLGSAIRQKPYLFNREKSRFSMDWFYPILCGAVRGKAARRRLDQYWATFVVEGHGVKCVSDEPWVTIAETSECCLALNAMGSRDLAETLFGWIADKVFDDGSYWCGYTYPDMVIWPEEKITWTNGVVLMAMDALYQITPAARLFDHGFLYPSLA